MAPPTDPSPPPSKNLEAADATTLDNLDLRGTLPAAASGRLLGAHAGVVHSVHLQAGQAPSYRSRQVRAVVGTDTAASDTFVFGGSILAFGHESLAHELSSELDTVRSVDLAGQSRRLSACPKHDPITGDLHLLAATADGTQAHVLVSSGALTRRSRLLLDAPNEVADLAITRDHLVFVADGFVGVTSRDSEARIIWIPTGVDAPVPVHAHDNAGAIVMYAITPSLERWTLNIGAATVRRDLLDTAPRRFARTSDHQLDGAPRFLWTIGDGTADTHDLSAGSHVQHDFGQRQPGDLVFVPDPARPHDADGGWLVGFIHGASGDGTDLVVLDAADISRPAVAAVRIPRRIPPELHTTWIPSTNQ
ncbi:MAG: carotenoid oxygenase family protein [Ilumatobacteraceae bacterium]